MPILKISRRDLGKRPPLEKDALQRVLDAPGLKIVAHPPEAVLCTLSALTLQFMHRTYDKSPSNSDLEFAQTAFHRLLETVGLGKKARVKSALRKFQTAWDPLIVADYGPPRQPYVWFAEVERWLGSTRREVSPSPPLSWVAAQKRWFTTLMEDASPCARGRPKKRLHGYVFPRLLAFFRLVYGTPPRAGSSIKDGPAPRFLRMYFQEVNSALWAAGFATEVERKHFIALWKAPAYLQMPVRKRPIPPEPDSNAHGGWGIPAWMASEALIIGVSESVRIEFHGCGGETVHPQPGARMIISAN